MQSIKFYTIDLTKIKGKGDFKCPKCGIKISPDDKTDDTYTIVKPLMKGESIEKIVLQCNRCRSQIRLTGFHVLNKIK